MKMTIEIRSPQIRVAWTEVCTIPRGTSIYYMQPYVNYVGDKWTKLSRGEPEESEILHKNNVHGMQGAQLRVHDPD